MTAHPKVALLLRTVFAAVGLCLATEVATAAEPLHQRIDQIINAAPFAQVATVCSDVEFLRRVSLDLNGITPSAAEVRVFMDDPAPDKRVKLVDRLLASSRFARQMANTFNVLLMERRADGHVPAPEWEKFLYESFLANKPYDQLVREIIASDGTDPATRPAGKFFLERSAEPNLMTRDIGRLFFGRDLQCAQCHNSPIVDDFYQTEYYGILAFVTRSFLFNDVQAKKQFLAEKAEGEASFSSVFTKEAGSTSPRLPNGTFFEDPLLPIGEEYAVKPADTVRPVPKYSRRAKLAEVLTTTNNPQFNRNLANRLWAMMLGRGLVHPLEFDHSDNPPSHPQLLELLTTEIAATKYDIEAFMREIALTQTYQRSIELPADWTTASQKAAELLAAIDTEQKQREADLEKVKEAAKQPEIEFDAAKKAAAPTQEELNKITTVAVEARKQWDTVQAQVNVTQTQLAQKQDFAIPVSGAAAKAAEALSKLPNDAELKKAVDFFQARTTQLNNEIAAMTKTRDDQTVAAKVKQDAFATANTAIEPVRAKWQSTKQPLEAAREKYEATTQTVRAQNAVTQLAAKRLAGLRTLAGYNGLVAKSDAANAALAKLQADTTAAQQTLTQANADEAAKKAAEAKVAELVPQLAAASQQAQSARDGLAAAREQITQFSVEHFYVATLKPLSPEQLVSSLLNATGFVNNQITAANAELDKAAQAQAAAVPAPPLGGRERQVEENVFEKLIRPNIGPFVAYFGAGAGQPQDLFFATVDQALFSGNGGTVFSWAATLGNNLAAQQDPKLLAEELYLSTLSRKPTDAELVAVTTYLQSRGNDRVPAIQEMVWGLLSSAEFRFNH